MSRKCEGIIAIKNSSLLSVRNSLQASLLITLLPVNRMAKLEVPTVHDTYNIFTLHIIGKKLSSVTPRMNGVIHRRLSNGIKRGSKRILACSSKTKTTAKVKSQKMRTSSKFLNKVPKEESTDEESSSEEECDVFEGNGVIDEQMDEQKPGTSKQQKNEVNAFSKQK
jgi:hypothetical protein